MRNAQGQVCKEWFTTHTAAPRQVSEQASQLKS